MLTDLARSAGRAKAQTRLVVEGADAAQEADLLAGGRGVGALGAVRARGRTGGTRLDRKLARACVQATTRPVR